MTEDEDDIKPVISSTINFAKFAYSAKSKANIPTKRKSELESSLTHVSSPEKKAKGSAVSATATSSTSSKSPKKKADELQHVRLSDFVKQDLDVLIVGYNPGCNSATHGHHYAGPGNHFWKCLSVSGLVPEPLTFKDDTRIADFDIGLTNIVSRPSASSSDLSKVELQEGARLLHQKIIDLRPKIVCFNGLGIYEVFSGSKKFNLGKQPAFIPQTSTIAYVMPSSSPRGSKWPRMEDKLVFYIGLKVLRDHCCGQGPEPKTCEVVFQK